MDMERWTLLGQIVGVLVAILTLIGLLWQGGVGLRHAYRATLGRKPAAYRALAKLAANVHLNHFSSVLGTPVFKRAAYGHTEFVYVAKLFYVQVWVSEDDVVKFFSVTSRNGRFHPPIWNDAASWVLFDDQGKKLKLGQFHFADIPQWKPNGIMGHVGARRYGYTETYYFGNPGHYQTFVLGYSDAGVTYADAPNPLGLMPDLLVHIGMFAEEEADEDVDGFLRREEVTRFRRSAKPNLYGISAPHLNFKLHNEAGHVPIGPDADQMRLLPDG